MSAHASAHPQAVRLLAPAKLTLQLRITGTRSDGYHLIDAEMVTLDLCDELIVHPSESSSVEVVQVPGDGHGGANPPAWDLPTDGSNLVIRALELAGRTAHVEVRKRIPPGAGLGGGSADAAAVLRWANQLAAAEANDAEASRPPAPAPIAPVQAATLGADRIIAYVEGRFLSFAAGLPPGLRTLHTVERGQALWVWSDGPRSATIPDAAHCDPSYPGVCIPAPPPDLDCGDVSVRRFRVIGADPHRFDVDGDGLGCES